MLHAALASGEPDRERRRAKKKANKQFDVEMKELAPIDHSRFAAMADAEVEKSLVRSFQRAESSLPCIHSRLDVRFGSILNAARAKRDEKRGAPSNFLLDVHFGTIVSVALEEHDNMTTPRIKESSELTCQGKCWVLIMVPACMLCKIAIMHTVFLLSSVQC